MKKAKKSLISIIITFGMLVTVSLWQLGGKVMSPDSGINILTTKSVSYDDGDIDEQWYVEKLGAREVWDALEQRGKKPGQGVVVAVIDTGVDCNHADLKNNIWTDEQGKPGCDFVSDEGDMQDTNGHGTMMAGIIGMEANNGRGGIGLAYGAQIMPVRICEERQINIKTLIKGIEYAVNQGADIINLSMSSEYYNQELENTLKKASEKCVIVAAAGNEGYGTSDRKLEGVEPVDSIPAAYSSVIGVMSQSENGRITSNSTFSSNFDSYPGVGCEYEIMAPGNNIYSTYRQINENYDSYKVSSGTSQATAMVSGALAIYKSVLGDEVSPKELKEKFLGLMTDTTSKDYVLSKTKETVTCEWNTLNLRKLLPEIEKMDQGESPTAGPGESPTAGPGGTPTATPPGEPTPTKIPGVTPAPSPGVVPDDMPIVTPEDKEKQIEGWKKTKPTIKKKKLKNGKIKFIFNKKDANGYYIYMSKKKDNKYVTIKCTRKSTYCFSKKKKRKYKRIYVVAYREIDHKKYKSKKSKILKL